MPNFHHESYVVDMYTWMGVAEICKRAVADRRDPSQKSSSVAPKSGRDELHVSHDPSFLSHVHEPYVLFQHILLN